MKYIFPNYVNMIKECCKNPSITNENLIRALFEIFDKDEQVDIDKSDATHLMQREVPIPKKIMISVGQSNEEDLINNCKTFIDEILDAKKFDSFKSKIVSIIESDLSISTTVKSYIKDGLDKKNETFLYRSLIENIRIPNRILDKKVNLFKKGNNEINIYYGDVFKLAFGKKYNNDKKALVIPFNAEFDIIVNDDSKYCVSSNTLHGKWINNMVDHGYSMRKIKSRINQNLEKLPDDINERIGSIIQFKHDNTTFLLFAITKFIDGNATTTINELKQSIFKLIDYYNKECQGMTLFIPLIGTGMSRLNLSNYESYKIIKDLLFQNSNMIQGKVNILINFKDAEEIEESIYNEE